jgi:transposase InsO family protein
MEVVAVDMTYPQYGGQTYCILSVLCEFSRFYMSAELKSESGSAVMTALSKLFQSVGWPCFVRYDKGPALLQLANIPCIKLLPSVSDNPQSNGCVERVHRTLKSKLIWSKAVSFSAAWSEVVSAYNHAPHSSLDSRTPADVFYGRE